MLIVKYDLIGVFFFALAFAIYRAVLMFVRRLDSGRYA
jgi:hypothetical protein